MPGRTRVQPLIQQQAGKRLQREPCEYKDQKWSNHYDRYANLRMQNLGDTCQSSILDENLEHDDA